MSGIGPCGRGARMCCSPATREMAVPLEESRAERTRAHVCVSAPLFPCVAKRPVGQMDRGGVSTDWEQEHAHELKPDRRRGNDRAGAPTGEGGREIVEINPMQSRSAGALAAPGGGRKNLEITPCSPPHRHHAAHAREAAPLCPRCRTAAAACARASRSSHRLLWAFMGIERDAPHTRARRMRRHAHVTPMRQRPRPQAAIPKERDML